MPARSRGSPASRAMRRVDVIAASISAISAPSASELGVRRCPALSA